MDIHTYARHEPQVLQIEHHPYLTQEPLVRLAKDIHNMAITAYSSFGPQSYVELGGGTGAGSLLEHATIAKIASAHNRSASHTSQHFQPLQNSNMLLGQLRHRFCYDGQRNAASRSFPNQTTTNATCRTLHATISISPRKILLS